MPGAFLWGWDATAGAWVKCVVNADGKLIINPTGFLENPPTEDEALKAPTSEWAFDHDAEADAHHTKYTNAESRAAIGNLLNASGIMLKDLNAYYFDIIQLARMTFQTSGSISTTTFSPAITGQAEIRILTNVAGTGYVNAGIKLYKTNHYEKVTTIEEVDLQIEAKLENPPTEDLTTKAPTSEWAFDHDADADAHHAKYTDAEVLQAPSNNILTLTTGTFLAQSVAGKAIVYLNTSGGNIQIEGLADGYNGQVLLFLRVSTSNTVTLIYNSSTGGVDEEIYTRSLIDEISAAGRLGGFRAMHLNGKWYIDNYIS